MITETQLPKGWKKTTLGAEFEWSSGGTPKSGTPAYYENGTIHWLNISDLNDGLISCAEKQITELGLKESSAKIVPKNSVLIAIYGSIGKLGINTIPLATNQAICFTKKIPEYISNKFLFYYLLSIRNQLISMGKGGTQQNISQTVLKAVPFFYPTNKETQQAIVNKIESLFAEIDAGIASLKTAQQQLKHYRQSLLKNAFNGELTKQWRLENADRLPSANELLAQIQTAREQHHAQQLADWQIAVKQWEQAGKQGKKPSKPKAPTQAVKFEENFADLPNGWLKTQFGNTTEVFVGSTPSRKNNEYWNGDIFWVSSGEVKFSNIFDTKEKITPLGLNNSSTTVHPIGTVMLAMIGEGKTRGQAGILKIEACHNQNTAAIRVNKEYLLSEYLYYFLMFSYEQTRRIGSGNNQKALNKSVIENMFFPLCSLAEQTQIVAILESKLTACDQLASELATQLKQAELLKQAVLKSAFSGNLLDK